MYNQKEYIYNEFIRNYPQKDEPIVIYGIGVNTGDLLEKITDYNIVGLLDGKQKDGNAWGKNIIDLPEVEKKGYKTIVIVSRPAVIGMIYHRIADFAKRNGIFVGDVRGRNLAEIYKTRSCDNTFFHKNWSDLRNIIDEYNVISFDIFDTLLVRQIIYPKDIFRVVNLSMKKNNDYLNEFVSLRMRAEDELYKEGINPTIYQIYDRIKKITICSDLLINKYITEEINTEKKYIKPRKHMLDFFNSIINEKKVYLISDMYLPSDILKEILTDCGYEGYEKILVSCEYNCSKRDGLFKSFVSDEISEEKCLHIGDNQEADIESAQNAGLDTFFVMSELEMLENSSYSELEDKADSLLDRISLGLFCNRAFDDPFVMYGTKGKYEINGFRDLSYLLCAPEIFYFSCWLIKNIIKTECDYIVYPARDAYVLEKICKYIVSSQKIEKYADGKYIYVSRRALFAATLFDINDIDKVTQHEYNGTVGEMYKKRFNIVVDEPGLLDRKTIKSVNKKYEDIILAEAKKERENYISYIKREIHQNVHKVAFIDFVAAGSVQNGLRKLVSGYSLEGFYFMKRNTDDVEMEENLNVTSFYKPKGDFEIDDNIYKYYLFFELLLTSPEATLNYIGDDLKPIFLEETRDRSEISIVMDMQDEMLEYTRQISELHPDIFSEDFNKDLPDVIVGFLGQEYSKINCDEIKSMVLSDEYLSREFNIFDR